MNNPSFWSDIRKDFPITDKCIYLDHAAGGPIPLPVLEKIQNYYGENTHAADFEWMTWMKRRDEARKIVADFINADPEEITFTTSTSHGMNLIAELISEEGGVLLNESEFPSSTVPWLWRKANTKFLKPNNGIVSVDDIEKNLDDSIKTIVTSFIGYGTGYKQDIEALSKIKGDRYLAVNATQGFGAFPIDVKKWNVDFLCTNSYKWMMAGYGGGILYIKKDWLRKFKPSSVGWRSMVNPDEMNNLKLEINPNAERYEMGCPSFPTIFGFAAATQYYQEIGIENIASRIMEITRYLIQKLQENDIEVISPLKDSQRSGIVIAKISQPEKAWKYLLHDRIYTSPRGGGLRIAPHFYNSEEEIDLFIKALIQTIGRLK